MRGKNLPAQNPHDSADYEGGGKNGKIFCIVTPLHIHYSSLLLSYSTFEEKSSHSSHRV